MNDVFRILATEDSTVVSIEPEQPEIAGVVLNQGEWVEYKATSAHRIKAAKPVLVGHFMKSGDDQAGLGCPAGVGDPSLTFAVPVSGYLPSYVVVIPEGVAESWLNVVRPVGAVVTLDGKPLGGEVVPIAGATHEVVRIKVAPGARRLESALSPIGVTAYGRDCGTSYAFSGGRGLQ